MGRGRAKAKQTKVARELKYSSPSTDLESLQRELSSGESAAVSRSGPTSSEWDDSENETGYEDNYDSKYRR